MEYVDKHSTKKEKGVEIELKKIHFKNNDDYLRLSKTLEFSQELISDWLCNTFTSTLNYLFILSS